MPYTSSSTYAPMASMYRTDVPEEYSPEAELEREKALSALPAEIRQSKADKWASLTLKEIKDRVPRMLDRFEREAKEIADRAERLRLMEIELKDQFEASKLKLIRKEASRLTIEAEKAANSQMKADKKAANRQARLEEALELIEKKAALRAEIKRNTARAENETMAKALETYNNERAAATAKYRANKTPETLITYNLETQAATVKYRASK